MFNRSNASKGAALGFASALLLAASLVSAPAWAEKPEKEGKGKGNNYSQQGGGKHGKGGHDGDHASKGGGKQSGSNGGASRGNSGPDVKVAVGGYFGDSQRNVVRNYYGEQYKAGRCPPGLAKKNNGCMPPGQAKKYMVGQRLPSDVVFYPVPAYLVTQLGTPPSGHRYVRVAGDILLLAVGTSMVVDALSGLGVL